MADVAETSTAAAPEGVAAGSPAIRTVELSKRFGKTVALAGLSMTVPRGEVFGFLGPNGAGKTTSVKLLLGLIAPTSGEGWLLGKPIGDLQTRRKIGYLPELFRYQSWLSAREVLALHCELAPLPRSSWKDEITTALDTVGLTDRAGDRVGTFSKGMQQRLGLAVALIGEPELVFLDEPTSALDPVGRHDVREIIRGLAAHEERRYSSTHTCSARSRQMCDRVAVVDHGRVIASGTMDQLLSGTTVRVRVTGLPEDGKAKLAAFGQLDDEGDQLTFTNLNVERVPELVAAIVALGGRVYEVAPRHQTLEDRFLQLLEEEGGLNPPMPPVLVIARLTIHEASRRRLLLALVILTLIVVGFSAWGFNKIATVPRVTARFSSSGKVLSSQLLIVVTFMYSGVSPSAPRWWRARSSRARSRAACCFRCWPARCAAARW